MLKVLCKYQCCVFAPSMRVVQKAEALHLCMYKCLHEGYVQKAESNTVHVISLSSCLTWQPGNAVALPANDKPIDLTAGRGMHGLLSFGRTVPMVRARARVGHTGAMQLDCRPRACMQRQLLFVHVKEACRVRKLLTCILKLPILPYRSKSSGLKTLNRPSGVLTRQ